MEENKGTPGNLGIQPNSENVIHKKPSSINDPLAHLEDVPKTEMGVDETSFMTSSPSKPRNIYMNWQFVILFISVSLGFNASFLGTINGWNGAQVVIPVSLAVKPVEALIAPLNLTGINDAVNLTVLDSALNLTTMATGVNIEELFSSFDWSGILNGLENDNITQVERGINVTSIEGSLNLTRIESGINETELATGLNTAELIESLNLTVFVPGALDEISYGYHQVKQGLWTYPTLIFAQILSSVFFGRLSDYVGRRWIFLFGNLVSFISFLAAGRAQKGATIAGLSTLIGIGTGIQILGPWLALAEIVPVSHRFTVTGLSLSMLAPLIALHAAIFQAFLEKTGDGWRWSYYVNAIMSFVALIGFFISYHPPTYHQLHNHPTDEPPLKDWVGLTVFTASIATVAYALGWGKLTWSWDTAQVIAIVVICGLSLVGFLIYEYFWGNDHSAYPAYLIRDYKHVSQMILASLVSLVWLFGSIVQFVCFLTVTPRFGMKGAWENLWGAGLALGFIVASITLYRPKHLKWHAALSTMFTMVFLAALRGMANSTAYRVTMAMCFLLGFGLGYATVVTYVTAPMTARKKDIGLVVGLVSAFRGLNFAAIRSLFLTLYINQLEGNAQRILPAAFLNAGPLPQSLQSILGGLAIVQRTDDFYALLDVPIIQTMVNALIETLMKSWHFIIELAYIYFMGSLLYAFTCPDTDSYLSNDVFVHMNRGTVTRLLTRTKDAQHSQISH